MRKIVPTTAAAIILISYACTASAQNLMQSCMGYFLSQKGANIGSIIFASFLCPAMTVEEPGKCPMLDSYPQKINYSKKDIYKKASFQTKAGPYIKSAATAATAMAESLGGHGLDYFRGVSRVIHSKMKGFKNNQLINKRDAEQILAEGNPCGCHDWATVGAAVFRQMGYAVVAIDSADIAFLEGGDHAGHAMLEVFDPKCNNGSGCWMLYDPTAGTVYNSNDYSTDNIYLPGDRILLAKGLEYWSMPERSNLELTTCLDIFRDEFYSAGKVSYTPVTYHPIDLLH